MNPVSIVVLSRYWEIFSHFEDSAELFAPAAPRILVRDPGNPSEEDQWQWHLPELAADWTVITAPKGFSMARNANLGVHAAPAGSDILYCGDDVRFTETRTLERLQQIAYAHSEVGILSPRLEGRASAPLANPRSACDYVRPIEMWFPCVYVKRELMEAIGDWDERFDSFGDDFDYSVRAELAGYRCAVTNAVTVRHEGAPLGSSYDGTGPSTFVRKLGTQGWQQQSAATHARLAAKYQVTPEILNAYFRTGDLKLLAPGSRLTAHDSRLP